MEKKFQKRFGDRINVVFLEKPLTPAKQKVQNDSLVKAITEVLNGILKREPTEAELLGMENISVKNRIEKK